MENISAEQQDSVLANGESADHSQRAIGHDDNSATSEEQAPKLETYPRKHGFSWASAEKIDGIINPKQHVDWVMMSQFGISLEYLINFVHNLCDQEYCRFVAFEKVMAQFGFDDMHADIVSESVFGEPFYALIADIHGWISDYEPDEDDEDEDEGDNRPIDWSRNKRDMHEYLVWTVMEDLAFLKMDEVNPNQ